MVEKIATIVLVVLLGLCVGSFLNVVIYRLPRSMSLSQPASHCPKCNNKIKFYDNIPLLSYVFLKGKCRRCGQKISIRYPIIELMNVLLWILAMFRFTNFVFPAFKISYLMLITSCLIFSVLLCIFVCDLDNMEIPDELQICLLILGIVCFLDGNVSAGSRVYGFLLGGGFFGFFALLFYVIKKKECLGFGDIKLMAILGLILGFSNTILCLILSTVSGAIILSIKMIINKGDKHKEYPFATFIVPSAIICLLVGEYVVNWYLSLFVV